MKNIVIIGAGGFGREVKWFIDEINGVNKQWNFIGFVDDNLPKGTVINDSNVIGDVASRIITFLMVFKIINKSPIKVILLTYFKS